MGSLQNKRQVFSLRCAGLGRDVSKGQTLTRLTLTSRLEQDVLKDKLIGGMRGNACRFADAQ
jgi:hypothetical protein